MSKRNISKRSKINNDRVTHQEQKDIEKALRQSLLETKGRSTSKTKSQKQRSSPRTLKNKSPITGSSEKQELSVVKGKDVTPNTKQKNSKATGSKGTATDGSSLSFKPSLRPSSAYVPPPPLELMKEDIFVILSDEDGTSSSTSDTEFVSGKYKKKKNAESTTGTSQKRKSKSDDCLPAKKRAYTKEKVQPHRAVSSSKTLSEDLSCKNKKVDVSSSSSFKSRLSKGILKKAPLMYVISNDNKLIIKTSPAQSKRTPSPRIQKKLFKKTPSPSVGSPSSTTSVKKVLSSLKSPKTSSLKDCSSSTPPNKKTSPRYRKTPPPAIAKKTACAQVKKTPIKKDLKKTPTKIRKTPVKKLPSSKKTTPPKTSVHTIPKTPESKSKKAKFVRGTDTEGEKEKQLSSDGAHKKIVEPTTSPVERSPLSICGFQAQRKFPVNITPTRAISSGSSHSNNVNEIESVSSISDELLVAKEVPKTEDFLLYLCLRTSNVLPKELSFFNVPWTPPQFSKQTRVNRQIVHQPSLSVAKKTAAKILF